MSDEKLRAALRDLHDTALSVVTPPGVEMARRTVRRRHATRIVLAATAAILLGFAALTMPGKYLPPPATKPSPSPSASQSPSLSPSATPTPATPIAGTPTAAVSQSGGTNASGVGLAPYFVEYGDGFSTAVGQTGTTNVPIGVMTWGSGTATDVKLTVDLSHITGQVDIVAVSSPCSQSGSTVVCDFGSPEHRRPEEHRCHAYAAGEGRRDSRKGRQGLPHADRQPHPDHFQRQRHRRRLLKRRRRSHDLNRALRAGRADGHHHLHR
jgi:hypothetical protein